VNGSDTVLSSGTASLNSSATGNHTDIGLCSRPAGSAGVPLPLGTASDYLNNVETLAGRNALTTSNAAILPAGTHEIGMCVRPDHAFISNDFSTGWVLVLRGTGAIE